MSVRGNQHTWDGQRDNPIEGVNMSCSRCGMQQKPLRRGSTRWFYRMPGEEWVEHKRVPWCWPVKLRIEETCDVV